MSRKSLKISTLGAGLWGTVLANHLAGKGHPVSLWEFFPELARNLENSRKHPHLPDLELDRRVQVTSDIGAAARGAEVLLFVLPSSFMRGTARNLRPLLDGAPRQRHSGQLSSKPFSRAQKPLVVNASKGVEPGSLQTMGEVLEDELPELEGRVYTLSGPSFAREVARGVPTKLVLAGPRGPACARLREAFDGDALRVETSEDRKGVELGGSLKNVLAVGCGMLDGMRAGANTKAALLTQGIGEMGLLIRRHGGKAETIYGLSGLGDLIATGTSSESRNRGLGEKLGSGKGLKVALGEIPTVAEGVEAARSAYALTRAGKLKAPLIEAIWKVIHRGRDPRLVIEALGFQ